MAKYEQADFEKEIERRVDEAKSEGKSSLEIKAGDVNKAVAGKDNRMVSVCSAMRRLKEEKYVGKVLSDTDSGNSSTFTVRYHF